MRLRVVAGELGGRVIEVPRRPGLRATSGRVREAWFSALGVRIHAAAVADLFAGSGVLGIEALSRGAARVDFVEADRPLAEALRRNLQALGLVERSRVLRADVFATLDGAGGRGWDVVLADPPYREGLAVRLATCFRERPFAGLLCLEHDPGALSAVPDAIWSRRYGDTELTFLEAGRPDDERDEHP